MSIDRQYYRLLAAAYVRGVAAHEPQILLEARQTDSPLDALGEEDLLAIVADGIAAGLKMHRFKRTELLPRVKRVIGILRGLAPESVLDVGSGRGAFLWPLLDAFPQLCATAIDPLLHRAELYDRIREGGFERLNGQCADATALPFADQSFDGVCALEVLEHIPEVEKAVQECVRVSRRFVVASVPSTPDDNPEHIHLFTVERLRTMFQSAGAGNVNFEHVPNHRIVVVTL